MHFQHALVADENPLCRGGLIALLKDGGTAFSFVEASNFAEAVAGFSPQPPTLAVVDQDLPGLSNSLGIRILRNRDPSVRIVVMASHCDGHQVLEALAAGAHGFLLKGLAAPDMIKAFESVMSGQIYVPPRLSEIVPDGLPGPQEGRAALTERQTEVIQLVSAGKSNKEIARTLSITEGTVKVHVSAAFRQLGVHNRISAAAAIGAISRRSMTLWGGWPAVICSSIIQVAPMC